MNTIAWLIFGGLAGWIATMITGDDVRFGILGNIVIGIVGSYIGGWLSTKMGSAPPSGFDLRSFVISVLGAVVLLFVIQLIF
jgi:uncharacterized membrane protein YeaQ/YmgE (transglycosylase-associated protein family)